jgi:hypothetical protein
VSFIVNSNVYCHRRLSTVLPGASTVPSLLGWLNLIWSVAVGIPLEPIATILWLLAAEALKEEKMN